MTRSVLDDSLERRAARDDEPRRSRKHESGGLQIASCAPTIHIGVVPFAHVVPMAPFGALAFAVPAPRSEQGAVVATGRPLDLCLCGKGYFVVGDAHGPSYSRSGAFALDPSGRLVSRRTGRPVLGWQGGVLRPLAFRPSPDRAKDADGGRRGGGPLRLCVERDGTVFGRYGDGTRREMGRIAVAGFLEGFERVGALLWGPSPCGTGATVPRRA